MALMSTGSLAKARWSEFSVRWNSYQWQLDELGFTREQYPEADGTAYTNVEGEQMLIEPLPGTSW